MVYLFICHTNRDIHGYTMDHNGSNLPTDVSNCLDGWQFISGIQISENVYSLIGENPQQVIQAIDKYGYFVKSKGSMSN